MTSSTKDLPPRETFTLPDLTPISVHEIENQKLVVSIGKTPKSDRTSQPSDSPVDSPYSGKQQDLEKDLRSLVEFVYMGKKGKGLSVRSTSSLSKEDDEEVPIVELKTLDGDLSFEDLWSALYAFWTRKDLYEAYPLHIGQDFNNQEKVFKYLTYTGLAVPTVTNKGEDSNQVSLIRSAFWQGAGAPLSRSWIRSPQPHPAVVGDLMSTSFPYIASTSLAKLSSLPSKGGMVHPLRAPKPPPGAVLYSRYIHSTSCHLQLIHLDPSNEDHLARYTKWKKSAEDTEADDKEQHKKHLQDKHDSPHTISFISTWDGAIGGYGEVTWSKEDASSSQGGSLDDYDQSTYSLTGEGQAEKHAGQALSAAHLCFLREARTRTVVDVGKEAERTTRAIFFTNTAFY